MKLRTTLAALLLTCSGAASADPCTAYKTVAGYAVGGAIVAKLAALPVTAVAHSSGASILTGAAGYVPGSYGLAATVFGIVTSPLFIIPLVTVGGGYIAYCAVRGT